jgi:hypothetical protein
MIQPFDISECMLLIDVVKEDRQRWFEKYPEPSDILDAYDSIIMKLQQRIDEYNGFQRALRHIIM